MPFNIEGARKAGYSDQEINSYLQKSGRSIRSIEQQAAIPTAPREEFKQGPVGRNAPLIGSILGGFLGPVGSGAGYSIGRSFGQTIPEQFSLFGERGGDTGAETGLQRLGVEPGETAANAAKNLFGAVASGELSAPPIMMAKYFQNLMEGKETKGTPSGEFVENVGESATVATVDAVMNKAINKAFAGIGKKFPRFSVGGVLPKQIAKSADETRAAVFKPVKEALDKYGGSARVDIQPVLDDLMERGGRLMKDYLDTPTKNIPVDAVEEMNSVSAVLDELTRLAKDGHITLDQAQDMASRYGKKTFTPKTGTARETTNVVSDELLRTQRQAGAGIRGEEISTLKDLGVEGADDIFKQYGQLSGLSKTMKYQPFKGAFTSGILGTPLGAAFSLAGNPAAGLGLTFGLPFLTMPLGRQVGLQALKGLVRGAGRIPGVGVSSYLQDN